MSVFREPLLIGFKSILRSWHPDVRLGLENAFIEYINDELPDSYVPPSAKSEFIHYLKTYWFNSNWKNTYTAEVIYNLPERSRRNRLVLTNNPTERKNREIDEVEFLGNINKLMTGQVNAMLNSLLPRESEGTYKAEKHPVVGLPDKFPKKTEREKIKRALDIVTNKQVEFLPEWWETGWALVQGNNVPVASAADYIPRSDDIDTEAGEDDVDTDFSDNVYVRSTRLANSQPQSNGSKQADFGYSVKPTAQNDM
jgi:hypothetical protein